MINEKIQRYVNKDCYCSDLRADIVISGFVQLFPTDKAIPDLLLVESLCMNSHLHP